MRVLPSGTTALLVELDHLDEVLGLYTALREAPPDGVVELVPAARTLLVVTDPARTTLAAVEHAVRATVPQPVRHGPGAVQEVPVVYDGADLAPLAAALDLTPDALVRRHGRCTWTVAFCGFTAGFGYATSPDWPYEVPRLACPRTRVPAGAVAVAGPFSAVYPSASPGGWQLLGRTALTVLDLAADPPVLLRPGVQVRYVDVT